MAGKKSLAQLIRDREVDEEQARLRQAFLANPTRAFLAATRVFGQLKIERIRKVGATNRRDYGKGHSDSR